MTTQLLVLAIALVAAGALVGFMAGLFGVGGGTVAVPVLYEVFAFFGVPDDLRMPLCAGTSLALIIPTSIASFRTHRKAALTDDGLLRAWIIPVVLGVALGTVVARYAPHQIFKILFIVVALVTAWRLLFRESFPRYATNIPPSLIAPYGVIVGAVSSLVGIGGGLLTNIVMTLHGRAIHQAIATSAGVGVLVSLPGTVAYMAVGWDKVGLPPFSIGFVSLAAVALLMPASLLTAKLGARLAHLISKRHLEVAFGLYLVAVSAQFSMSLVQL